MLLVNDHDMVRTDLRMILNNEDDLEVMAEASNGKEAITLVQKNTTIDVIVMDVDMPVMGGIEAARKIISILPEINGVGLSLHGSQSVIDSMQKAGASVYLTKDEAF